MPLEQEARSTGVGADARGRSRRKYDAFVFCAGLHCAEGQGPRRNGKGNSGGDGTVISGGGCEPKCGVRGRTMDKWIGRAQEIMEPSIHGLEMSWARGRGPRVLSVEDTAVRFNHYKGTGAAPPTDWTNKQAAMDAWWALSVVSPYKEQAMCGPA